jgi:hypothetical protein
MKPRIYLLLIWGLAAAATQAQSLERRAAGHAAAERLLTRKVIRLSAEGASELSFGTVQELLQREDLLMLIQQNYADTLPAGEKAEFTIREAGAGHYFYVNRHQQETQIHEIYRRQESEGRQVFLYYTEGRRFFGRFESLTQITLKPEPDGLRYAVEVAFFPEQRMFRWLARTGPVRRYVSEKTRELMDLAMTLCDRIEPVCATDHSKTKITGKEKQDEKHSTLAG